MQILSPTILLYNALIYHCKESDENWSFENVRPLRVNNKGTATASPVYTLNATSLDDFAKKTTLGKNVSTSSTWGCLLGVRLIF